MDIRIINSILRRKNMIKKGINKKIFISVAAIILIVSFSIISGAGFMNPGSEEDPLITLSYVEKRIEQIKSYIDQNFETINNDSKDLKAKVDQLSSGSNNINTSGEVTSEKFQVVVAEAGNTIVFGESAEVIWRSGKATAIASENGGLSDVTGGVDLPTGEEIPLNHLLIIPRNDGRGAAVTVKSYVMIKGVYTIQ
jgi:hypothetical protein